MTGALFISCHVQPPVLNAMDYRELKRWHDWLKLSNEYEAKQAENTGLKLRNSGKNGTRSSSHNSF